ncbi:transglutaminase [Aquimarina sp. 2201CG5-10]|uniref:transglutaminase n=1 Tax=Aquimarina callyspongiae TaxID=3098150 RepID=UPI002AB39468|nr:transglutaminase [Aquimarina sp. 2201CG5-10]MDY8136498.1 transglutaminase [Aquimarina sp. 2201CG5-10]
MRTINKLITGILLLCATMTMAQEYKFGKVSKEELSEVSYPLDSSANAAVLYENKRVRISFNESVGFQLVTDVFKRVKLYNKEGFDYASDEIYLYKSGSNDETVSGLKGVTYNLSDDKIVETKLKKDGIFKSEFSENYNQVKFTMPTLQEGSVIEYKYKITSPFIYNIDKINLQYDIPIKKLEAKVETPEYYNFKKFTTGYLSVNLKETSYGDKITITSKTRSGVGGRGSVQTSYSKNSIDHIVNVNTILSNNVPAFKEEPYSGNINNYISSISYELSFVKFPNEPIDYRSTTWEDVVKTIYKNSKFGDELKKTNYYKEDIDNLISGVSDAVKKTALIYDFVKKKMNWNKKRSVITRKGVKKAYKEETGNAAEINLMLASMLEYAGVDTNPVLVSTSDRIIALFPTLDGFNYVISRVKFPDGKIIYLDATDKYGMPNILPDRVIRGAARVLNENGTSQRINLRPIKPSANRYSLQCEIDPEGSVKGIFNVQHLGYSAHDFRIANAAKDDESKAERFRKRYAINELDEYTAKGIKEYGKGVTERFNFACEDQIEVIEDEMFFSPLLFLKDEENVFKSNERQYPVDFGYGFSNMYMINIKIPEGYEVAEFPKPGAFKLPDNLGVFSYRSTVVNGMVQIVVNETINAPIITSDYYGALKEFYNQLIEKENEQVVLKKI